jgi:hypothetical protein
MRTLVIFLVAAVAGIAGGQDKKPPKKETPIVKPREGKNETINLFDGKTLDGWEGYHDLWSEGYSDLWSVKEGVIVAKNTDPLEFSTYLLTKGKYTDFRLTFAAKLVQSEMH